MYIRIVFDTNSSSVKGAQVTATNQPMLCPLGAPATSQSTTSFVTNSTEWYSLSGPNNAGYSFVVKDSGQTYSFSASLRPVLSTCISLYLPSGNTNVTSVMSDDCISIG